MSQYIVTIVPQFHLEQARLRSELRIKNNRANPIDLLAYYIHHANDSTGTEIVGEPLSVVQVTRVRLHEVEKEGIVKLIVR